MKILFVNPPGKEELYTSPPLGMAYLASVLRKEHEVDIVDCSIDGFRGLERRLNNIEPDVVGVTAMTPNMQEAVETIKFIKRTSPGSRIIMGGPHVTVVPQETLKNINEVDVVVRGEGEETCKELFSKMEKNKPLNSVKGISFRHNKVFHTENRPLIENLDKIPFPSRDILPIKKYRQSISREKHFTTMMTTRGCPFNCLYCVKGIFGRVYRSRSPENIIAEIEKIINDYSIKEIIFYDDTFTLQKERIIRLCDLIIKHKLDISWKCETRVDLVDRKLLIKMKRAGCYLIAYGVESGNPELLKVVRKGIKKDQIRKTFRLTKECGIETIAYFMFGIPGETKMTMKQTLDFAMELDPNYAQFSIATPLPGTDLYKLALEKGLLNETDWSKFSYLGKKSYPLIKLENITPEELIEARNHAMRKFYFRPKYAIRKIAECKNPYILKRNIYAIKTLLKSF